MKIIRLIQGLLRLIQGLLRRYFPVQYQAHAAYFNAIADSYKLKKQARAVNKVIKEADKRHDAEKRRFYVMKDAMGNPFCASKKELNKLVEYGLYPKRTKHFTYYELEQQCLYHTDQK